MILDKFWKTFQNHKMSKENNIDKETYEQALEFQRIGNIAVRKAQEENRQLGIPNVYGRDGKIIYEMPDGEIIVKNIEKEERKNFQNYCWKILSFTTKMITTYLLKMIGGYLIYVEWMQSED